MIGVLALDLFNALALLAGRQEGQQTGDSCVLSSKV